MLFFWTFEFSSISLFEPFVLCSTFAYRQKPLPYPLMYKLQGSTSSIVVKNSENEQISIFINYLQLWTAQFNNYFIAYFQTSAGSFLPAFSTTCLTFSRITSQSCLSLTPITSKPSNKSSLPSGSLINLNFLPLTNLFGLRLYFLANFPFSNVLIHLKPKYEK